MGNQCEEGGKLGSARFAGAIAVHDAAFGQIVRGDFYVDAIAGKNLDAMTAQTPRDVCEDYVTVVQFD